MHNLEDDVMIMKMKKFRFPSNVMWAGMMNCALSLCLAFHGEVAVITQKSLQYYSLPPQPLLMFPNARCQLCCSGSSLAKSDVHTAVTLI